MIPRSAGPDPGGADAPAHAVRIRDVTKYYRLGRRGPVRTAVDGVSLSIETGRWVALLGPNGSGKSTLLRQIATLERPDQGTVEVLGVNAAHSGGLREIRRGLGVVFQHPGLDGLLTVRENLMVQAALAGRRGGEARTRCEQVAREMGIADRLDDQVRTLSGGLARRCDLARALVNGPRLLLLDEPTVGLDIEARAAFMQLLESRTAGAAGLTIIMTTHLIDEAERAGKVVMMNAGRVVAMGTPAELRGELGARTLRCASCWAHELERAGMRVRIDGSEACAWGDAGEIEHAVRALLELGADFQLAAPTLSDVFRSVCGDELEHAERGAIPSGAAA